MAPTEIKQNDVTHVFHIDGLGSVLLCLLWLQSRLVTKLGAVELPQLVPNRSTENLRFHNGWGKMIVKDIDHCVFRHGYHANVSKCQP